MNRKKMLENFCSKIHEYLEASYYNFEKPIIFGEKEVNELFDNYNFKYEISITKETFTADIVVEYNELAHKVDDFIYSYLKDNPNCTKVYYYKPLQPTVIEENKIVFEAVVGFENNSPILLLTAKRQ